MPDVTTGAMTKIVAHLRTNGVMSTDYAALLIETLAADRDRLAAENAVLREAWNAAAIGGNHLATYRTDRWPGYALGGLTIGQLAEQAIRVLGATPEYDMWCCWSAIMRAREAIGEP